MSDVVAGIIVAITAKSLSIALVLQSGVGPDREIGHWPSGSLPCGSFLGGSQGTDRRSDSSLALRSQLGNWREAACKFSQS